MGQWFQSWDWISCQTGRTCLRRRTCPRSSSLPKGLGSEKDKHSLILPPPLSSLPAILSLLHPPPLSGSSPQRRGLCTTSPSAASRPQVTLQMPVQSLGFLAQVDDQAPEGQKLHPCTLRGWHCTRRTGKLLRVPSPMPSCDC